MKFNTFFVVGVPLTRLVRLGAYGETNIQHSRRRVRLKPETLLSYPGGENEENEESIRASTCLESAISNFCFPEGYAKVDNQQNSNRSGSVVYFNVKSTALRSQDFGSVLWCTALRVSELVETTWLIPYLLDLEFLLGKMKKQGRSKEKICSTLIAHFNYINKNSFTTKPARWACDYYYILITDQPSHRWSEAALRTFRDLSRAQESGIQSLGGAMAELSIPALPWARRSTTHFSLDNLKAYLLPAVSGSLSSKLQALQQYVDIVTEWPPPLLPCRISPMSRALLTMLRVDENRGKAVEYIIENVLSPSLTQKCIDLLTGKWLPLGLQPWEARLSHINTMLIDFTQTPVDGWSKIPPPAEDEEYSPTVRTDATISVDSPRSSEGLSNTRMLPKAGGALYFGCMPGYGFDASLFANCDAFYGEIVHGDGLPAGLLCWLQIVMLTEMKTVVASSAIARRGPLTLFLSELVRPYGWPHALIPVLPSTVRPMDMVDSPVPFVIGVNRLNLTSSDSRPLSVDSSPTKASEVEGPCRHRGCPECINHNKRQQKDNEPCPFHLTLQLAVLNKAASRLVQVDELKHSEGMFEAGAGPSTPCERAAEHDFSPTVTPCPNTAYTQLSTSTSSTFLKCAGTVAVSTDNMITNVAEAEALRTTPCACKNINKGPATRWSAEAVRNFPQACLVVPTVSGRGRLLLPGEILSMFELSDEQPTQGQSPAGVDDTPKTNYQIWTQILPRQQQTYSGDLRIMLKYYWPCEFTENTFDPYTIVSGIKVPRAFARCYRLVDAVQRKSALWRASREYSIVSLTNLINGIESVGGVPWLDDLRDDLEIEIDSARQELAIQTNKLTLLLILLPNLFVGYSLKLVQLLLRQSTQRAQSPCESDALTATNCSSEHKSMSKLTTNVRRQTSNSELAITPVSTGMLSEMSPSPDGESEDGDLNKLLFDEISRLLQGEDPCGFAFEECAIFGQVETDCAMCEREQSCMCCCCSAETAGEFQRIQSRVLKEAEELRASYALSGVQEKKTSFLSKWIGVGSSVGDSALNSAPLIKHRRLLKLLEEGRSAIAAASQSAASKTFGDDLTRVLHGVVDVIVRCEELESRLRQQGCDDTLRREMVATLAALLACDSPKNDLPGIAGCLSQWKSLIQAHGATQMSCQFQDSF